MSQKQESGFRGWYESYSGKKIVNGVYCIGASVVIIGALFKILHWPGASYVLMAGMFTEAFLFFIGTFDRPHADFHWEEVFPQLMGYGTDPKLLDELAARPKPTLLGGVGGGGSNTGSSIPGLSENEMNALKGGINDLAKTAVQLSELGKVATGSAQLAEKMEAATKAMDQMTGVQSQLVASSQKLDSQYSQLANAYQSIQTEAQQVAELTRNQQKSVENLNNQLRSVNAAYELQLNGLKTQSDAVTSMAADMQKMQTAMTDAARNAAAYEDGAKKLAAQVADLNKIYGNMLNALA